MKSALNSGQFLLAGHLALGLARTVSAGKGVELVRSNIDWPPFDRWATGSMGIYGLQRLTRSATSKLPPRSLANHEALANSGTRRRSQIYITP